MMVKIGRRRQQPQADPADELQQRLKSVEDRLQADFDEIKDEGTEALAAFEPTFQRYQEEVRQITGDAFAPHTGIFQAVGTVVGEAAQKVNDREKQKRLIEASVKELQNFEDLSSRGADIKRALSYFEFSPPDLMGEMEVNVEELRLGMQEALSGWFSALWKEMLTDDEVFRQLRKFMVDGEWSHRTSSSTGCTHYVEAGFELPVGDWNATVALRLENPDVDDFRGQKPVPASCAIARRAARALLRQDFTELKIVLAYCKIPEYRAKIGDVGYWEVVQEVVRLEREEMKDKIKYTTI